MIKRIVAVLGLFILITVAIVQAIDRDANVETAASAKDVGIEVGQIATDFSLTTLDNKNVKLSDFRGKKVMLNFWATWCPPCRAEMPDMQKFYEDMNGEIEIVAVNIDTTNDVQGFVEEMGVTFPILLDTDESVMRDYSIISIPTTFMIDENGVIRNKTIGALTYEQMMKLIEK